MSDWISVDERLPEDYEPVILTDNGEDYIVGYMGIDGWIIDDEWLTSSTLIAVGKLRLQSEPTHWTPIPNF